MGQLTGKVVIVTGAAQGMGRSHVERGAEEGALVVATDIRQSSEPELFADFGDSVVYLEQDVTNEADWDRVVDTAVQRFGRLDGLVNNAAIYEGPHHIEEETYETFERTMRINVHGTWWGVKKAAAPMRAAGGGSIVNISSTAGLRGFSGFSSYGTSKWAVRGLTKVAATDLGPFGIRVNSVHPGAIDETGMAPVPKSPEELEAQLQRVPLRRRGRTADISSMVCFLLSDASTFVTGVEHVLDGGATVP